MNCPRIGHSYNSGIGGTVDSCPPSVGSFFTAIIAVKERIVIPRGYNDEPGRLGPDRRRSEQRRRGDAPVEDSTDLGAPPEISLTPG